MTAYFIQNNSNAVLKFVSILVIVARSKLFSKLQDFHPRSELFN